MRRWLIAATLAAGFTVQAADAGAFCGFYVSGADAELFNNATQVVLMRQGTRTVLSMQNNYQGPPQNFAMVVPVPAVLQEEHVKTLTKDIFKRVDSLAAPRLVEYWEQDPCFVARPSDEKADMALAPRSAAMPKRKAKDLGVTVEAEFTVGEYEIVILSAKDSTGLDTWLRQNKYKIPDGAEPFLEPYVQEGWKFFVAKVNTEKVTFSDGMAMLSPLRFYYDSEKFTLPIRLGLMNSSGKQDLIVHILAPNKRYEVANYKNVTIPTNLNVREAARDRFGEFYAALFDRTLEKNPGAVVTEYSWDAASCDPCPTPALRPNELATLGMDVLDTPFAIEKKKKSITDEKKGDAVDDLIAPKKKRKPSAGAPSIRPDPRRRRRRMPMRRFVLTRLHARYDKDNLGEDLVFKEARPITGGREFRSGPDGTLEEGATEGSINNFQGRYAIRHEWKGEIKCENPRRGIWGGPPAGVKHDASPKPALDLAFVTRGKTKLAQIVKQDIPELEVKAGEAADVPPEQGGGGADMPKETGGAEHDAKKEKGGCSATGTGGAVWLVLLALAALLGFRRRRVAGIAVVGVLVALPKIASAFCGFYVSGADAKLFNNATQVVMMRHGTRTVLSMQNAYKGPPENFAMVVPVPVVLQEENVKTLAKDMFSRVDSLAAPRLVEYWEKDPCAPEIHDRVKFASATGMDEKSEAAGNGHGVKIEAEFEVGEYQIVILSAKDSTGLDTWLREQKYKIPEGAEPYLKPYVAQGAKFFVAKVNAEKVTFKDGMAMLSPLRFHYDTEKFTLPIRLGMMNSDGTQDLIVHILSPGQRYQVANYKNVTIPTNIDVKEAARERFGEFYAALFDRTLEKNPGAVVTEYSWDAGTCDPCPTPALNPTELATLGGDVLGTESSSFVLTRLHARYSKDGVSEDLVFEKAEPISGGREVRSSVLKSLEEGSSPASRNNFQGRYAIRHDWQGKIACEKPIRGRWGGPPAGTKHDSKPKAALDLAFVKRGGTKLAQIVKKDIPEIDVKVGSDGAAPAKAGTGAGDKAGGAEPAKEHDTKKEKGGCASTGEGGSAWLAALLLLGLAAVRRRRTTKVGRSG